jgi:uncharacterized membrane protein/cell division protein FtsL
MKNIKVNSVAEIRKELEEFKREQDSNNEDQKLKSSRNFEIFLGVLSASILIILIAFIFQKEQKITSLNSKVYQLNNQVGDLKKKNESLSKELHTLRNVRDNVNDLLTRYSSTGYTYLRFCNKTSRRISATRAYWDGSGWRSEGWQTPEAGECKKVYIGDNYRGKVYVYGKFYGENMVADNQWISGDSSFCAEIPGPFDIANSDERDNCSGSGREMVKMSEFPVFPGTNTWNFRD